jgi:hypothetical protein
MVIALYAFAIPSKRKVNLLFNVCCIIPINLVIFLVMKSMGVDSSALGFQLGSIESWQLGLELTTSIIVILVGIGMLCGKKIRVSKEFLILIVAYPVWAVFQQFLVMSSNVMMESIGWHPIIIAIVSGIAFGFLHWPFKPLVFPTLFLGIILSFIFQEHRSLLPIAMIHGITATCYYYWFLGRDVFAEKLKK